VGFLQIDRAVQLVWRDPDSIQLGVDPPLVRIDGPTAAEQRVLAALVAGVPDVALAAAARCRRQDVDAFVDRLAPALAGAEARASGAPSVVLRARTDERDAIAGILALADAFGARERDAGPGGRRAGIVVADHVVPIAMVRDWMREGIPHVAIVFGERDVTVTPRIVPGRTACLRCADLHRRDADPAWPAIAAQLLGRSAAAGENALTRLEAVVAALRRLEPPLPEASAPLDASEEGRALPGVRMSPDGARERYRIPAHAECGCRMDLQVA